MFESTDEPATRSRVSTGFEVLDSIWNKADPNSEASDFYRAVTAPLKRDDSSAKAFLPYVTIENEIRAHMQPSGRPGLDDFPHKIIGLVEKLGKVQAGLATKPNDFLLNDSLQICSEVGRIIKSDYVRASMLGLDQAERDRMVHRACTRISSGKDGEIKAGEQALAEIVRDNPNLAIDGRFHAIVLRSYADMFTARQALGLGAWSSDLRVNDVLPEKPPRSVSTQSVAELSENATEAFFREGIERASPRFKEAIATADRIYDDAERNRVMLFLQALKQDAKIVQDGLQSRNVDAAVKDRVRLQQRQLQFLDGSQDARIQAASQRSNFAFAKIASGDDERFVEGKKELLDILSREPRLFFHEQFEETCANAFKAHYMKKQPVKPSADKSDKVEPDKGSGSSFGTTVGVSPETPKFTNKFAMQTVYNPDLTQDSAVKSYSADRITEAGLAAGVVALGLYGLLRFRNRSQSSNETQSVKEVGLSTASSPSERPASRSVADTDYRSALDRHILDVCQRERMGILPREMKAEADRLFLADVRTRAARMGLPPELVTQNFISVHAYGPMDGTKAWLRMDTFKIEIFASSTSSPTASAEHELKHVVLASKRTALWMADPKAFNAIALESASRYFGHNPSLPKISESGKEIVREFALKYLEQKPDFRADDHKVLQNECRRLLAELKVKVHLSRLPSHEIKPVIDHFFDSIDHYRRVQKSVIEPDILSKNQVLREYVQKEALRLESLKKEYGGSLQHHPEMRKALKGISNDTIALFDGSFYEAGSIEEIAARRVQRAANLRDYLRGGEMANSLDKGSTRQIYAKKVDLLIEQIKFENKLERIHDDLIKSRSAASSVDRDAHFDRARQSAKQITDAIRPNLVERRAENIRLRNMVDYFLSQNLIAVDDIPPELRTEAERPVRVNRSWTEGRTYNQDGKPNADAALVNPSSDTANSAKSERGTSSAGVGLANDSASKTLTESQRAGLKQITELAKKINPAPEQVNGLLDLAQERLRLSGCERQGLREFAALCRDYSEGKPDAVKVISEALGNRDALGNRSGNPSVATQPGAENRRITAGEQVTRAELQQRIQSPEQRAKAIAEAVPEMDLASRAKAGLMPAERAGRVARPADGQNGSRKEALSARGKPGVLGEAKGRAGAIAVLGAFVLDSLK